MPASTESRPLRPPLRRKPPGAGLQHWTLRQAARRSPVLRIDLFRDAVDLGFLSDTRQGASDFAMTLKRLRAHGCIEFDEATIQWTGRGLPVRSPGALTTARLRRRAGEDPEMFARLRQEEIARLQKHRDAVLAALRPPGAPAIDPAAFPAWRHKQQLVVTDGMRQALSSAIARRSRPRASEGKP